MSKIIVVVGASRGIGKAMVDEFAKDASATIYALSRDEERMRKQFAGQANVICKSFDLAEDCDKQLEFIFKDVEAIDLLINNAGYLVNKPFEELSHRDIARSYQVNVIGVMQTVQALLPKMEVKGAHVVNISSMGGYQGTVKFAGLAAYSTSKAAVVSFTELFAEEYKDSKVKMNCLCLGAVQTEMLHEAFPGYQALINPQEMAEYICHFALTANKWMNGRVIPVSLTTP